MTVQLTVYDGANVIGGNKILLETSDTALFFDFGTTFAERGRYFEEYLKPRSTRGLLDLVTMDLLPPLIGLYRQDLVSDGELIAQRIRRREHWRTLEAVHGVLLSHAHIDHSGYISFLRSDIRIYTTAMTAMIAKAMQDSSVADFEKEVCYHTPREERKPGLLQARDHKSNPATVRQFCVLDGPIPAAAARFWSEAGNARGIESKPITCDDKVGSLTVRGYPVDHSIFGAASFAVQTEIGWIIYTGDFRLHGKRAHLTEGFVQEAAKLQPSVLICEGTHVDVYTVPSEVEVQEKCLSAARRTKELVIADFGPRNIERLIAFKEIAKLTGRRLAVLTKDAYLLDAMRTIDDSVPDIHSDDTICIYRDAKATEAKWERDLANRYDSKIVDAKEVGQHQAEYILCLSFWDINELIDIDPHPGSVYIYSSSEAYDEEQQIDRQRLKNWLDKFCIRHVGLDEKGYHASGHITGPDLLTVIESIRPQIVVPVHTQNTRFFEENLRGKCQVLPPKRRQAIKLV